MKDDGIDQTARGVVDVLRTVKEIDAVLDAMHPFERRELIERIGEAIKKGAAKR